VNIAMRQPDLLDPDKIKANLSTKYIGRKILVYNSTASTNDIAAEYARDKNNNGLVIFAEEQTAGKGRGGNKWLSRRSESILCSIILIDSLLKAELLSLTCAVAAADAIGKAGSEAKIKWPNDVLLAGKKVAGILLESKLNNKGNNYIIGIGINCHQKKDSFPHNLQAVATSIDIESRTICDRISLAKRLLVSMDSWLEAAEKNPGIVTERWSQLSVLLGHRISLLYNGRKFSGNCIGIDPQSGLIIQLDTGGIRMFDAAHTSIEK
jgi:BirA family biotin operon repressor/biotin-[acetyl-CoA-carboxylase] ligase